MKIQGTEGMGPDQIRFEIQRGAKFVLYYYCISLLVVTLRRPSPVYFLPAGQSRVAKGLPWTLLTVLLGWWGIPWGPIYSIQSLVVNFKGGKDVTAEISATLQPAQAKATAASRL